MFTELSREFGWVNGLLGNSVLGAVMEVCTVPLEQLEEGSTANDI